MKKTVLSLSLASALLVQLPAFAAQPATPATPATAATPATPATPAQAQVVPAPKAPSPRAAAITEAFEEIADIFGNGMGNQIPLLEKMTQYQPSPVLRAKLMQYFGIERLTTVQALPAPAGKVAFSMITPAHRFTDPQGETFEWAKLDVRTELDKDGRQLDMNGSWPFFSFSSKDMAASVRDITLTGKQHRPAGDLWLGTANYRVGKVEINGGTRAAPGLLMENMVVDTSLNQRGALMDLLADMRIESVKVGGEKVENIRFASSMRSIEMKTFEALMKAVAAAKKQAPGADPVKSLAANKTQLIAFVKTMAARGTALQIDELSASFHGHKAKITGKIAMTRTTDADFENPQLLIKKIAARMEVRVPLAMINEVAATVTRQQQAAKGQPMSDAALAQASQGITDAVVGKAVTTGYGRVDGDVLASVMEIKNGKLTMNGKEVAMPGVPPAGAPRAKARK